MILGMLVLVITLIIGVPVAFSLGLSSLTIVLMNPSMPINIIAQKTFTGLDSFPFMAIPFFILAGELMNSCGITTRLVDFADSLVGHLKGGLAHINIVSSMFFAGITGSAVADTSAIGSIMIPPMTEEGYDVDFSAAVTAASSVVGPIIPPSIPMVVFALLSGTSVGGLFLAGIIPGVLLGLGLMIVAYFLSKKYNYGYSQKMTPFKEILKATFKAVIPLLMPIIILGGILSGVFTATEASAIAVVYSLIIGFFVYRSLSVKDLPSIFVETAKTTAMVFLVIGTANIFNFILGSEQIPQTIAEFFTSNIDSRLVFLLIINIILLIIGTFIEGTAAMILTVPVLLPTVLQFGIDPIMFGAIVVLNLMIGLITPPLGLCLFVASGVAKISLERIAKAVIPFLAIEIVVLLLTTYIEPITMFLPKLFGY
mgnify:FL=1